MPNSATSTAASNGKPVKEQNTMSQVVIENPIVNSPFDEPTCHFRFTDEGITDDVEG